jgi:hypothetical protein
VGPKDPLPYDVKVEAMKTVWPEVESHIVAETGWLTLASKVYKQYPDATLLCFTDEDWVTKTIQQYNGKEGQHGFYNFKNIEQKPTPRLSSATALRDAVTKGDRDAFSKAAGVDADTPVAGKPFFDLVAEYLLPYADLEKTIKDKKDKAAKKKVPESTGQLSVQQLATISDEALDKAYGYGRSSPGNTFGWQANLKSAAYAKQMIDKGVTDIEAISDAIHKGWNVTAKAFVTNPDQFDDTEKLRAAGKLDAKLQQREKLMNIAYAQLSDEEQEKDRVVARAMLTAIKGKQGMSERVRDPEDWDEGNTEPGNNFAVYINGKKWKVLPGPYGAYADSPEERREFYRLKDMAERKSRETGKKWEVSITGEPPTV